MTPLDRISKALGGSTAIAKLCEVTPSAVRQWADNGIPGKHVLSLEEATKRTDYPVTAREMLEWAPKKEAA
jgi:DNA-binding transcriptional regulator YdaS (Cro superfamily)